MAKIKVTDEMAARAWESWHSHGKAGQDSMRLALEAALNPPPEPEIPVSEGMQIAGANVMLAIFKSLKHPLLNYESAKRIYCAMESRRMEERDAEPKAQPGECDHDWRFGTMMPGGYYPGYATKVTGRCARCGAESGVPYDEFCASAKKHWPPGIAPRANRVPPSQEENTKPIPAATVTSFGNVKRVSADDCFRVHHARHGEAVGMFFHRRTGDSYPREVIERIGGPARSHFRSGDRETALHVRLHRRADDPR